MPQPVELSVGQCTTLACLLEASAPKPGNVHPGADFDDMTFQDFLLSATAIAPAMDRAVACGVGATVRDAIAARCHMTPANTNLGTVLLLAPLAAVERSVPLEIGIAGVLRRLAPEDSHAVYQAIRMASPGGLGRVDEMDVAAAAPPSLLDAMRRAAQRDLVARQYVADFATIFQQSVPWLVRAARGGLNTSRAIVHTFVRLLAEHGDSLIERKCGGQVSREAAARAAIVLESHTAFDANYRHALADLDAWLRADSHRRNPGTIADLIAATLFVVLRDRLLPWPLP